MIIYIILLPTDFYFMYKKNNFQNMTGLIGVLNWIVWDRMFLWYDQVIFTQP